MGYILPLFHWSFWFSARAIPLSPWAQTIILTLLAVLLAGGAACAWIANAPAGSVPFIKHAFDKFERDVLRRAAACALSASLVGWVLFFLVWQEVPYLSARIFWLLWLLGFGLWAFRVGRYARLTVPGMRAARTEREAYEKWLPKPKSKKRA